MYGGSPLGSPAAWEVPVECGPLAAAGWVVVPVISMVPWGPLTGSAPAQTGHAPNAAIANPTATRPLTPWLPASPGAIVPKYSRSCTSTVLAARALLVRNRFDDQLGALRHAHRGCSKLERRGDERVDLWSVEIVG